MEPTAPPAALGEPHGWAKGRGAPSLSFLGSVIAVCAKCVVCATRDSKGGHRGSPPYSELASGRAPSWRPIGGPGCARQAAWLSQEARGTVTLFLGTIMPSVSATVPSTGSD